MNVNAASDPLHAPLEELCGVLLGGGPVQDKEVGKLLARCAEELPDFCRFHGVQAAIFQVLATLEGVSPALLESFRSAVLERAAWELRSRELNLRLLAALTAAGIDVLVFKGAALAYSLYPNPVLRPRTDTDLLVPENQREHAESILKEQGFMPAAEHESVIVHQRNHALVAREGGTHNVDLHWKINNSQCIAAAFDFRELHERSEPLHALGPEARSVGEVDALLIACFHRRVHARYTEDRLVWLRDIDLLARRLSTSAWQQFSDLALAKGLVVSCLEGLQLASARFATPLHPEALEALVGAGPGKLDCYLGAGSIRRAWLDLRACDGAKAAVAYGLNQLFPSSQYMQEKYAAARFRWLPWLHLRRLSGGLLRHRIRDRASP